MAHRAWPSFRGYAYPVRSRSAFERSHRWALALLALVGLCRGWASDSAPAKSLVVGVAPFAARGAVSVDRQAMLAVEDQLQQELTSRNGITLVERTRIESVFAERQLQTSGVVDPATATSLGKLLGCDVLVVGAWRTGASGPSDSLLVNARAVRLSDGAVVWAGEATGTAAAIVAQAPALGEACAGALGLAPRAAAGATASMAALMHHERAAALRGAGLGADAVAEELLALREQPDLAGGDAALMDLFVAAGCPQLAIAEAKAALAANPGRGDADRLQRLAKQEPPAPPAQTAAAPSASVRAVKQIIDRIAALPPTGATRRDLITAWIDYGQCFARESRDRSALAAFLTAAELRRALRLDQPRWDFEETPDYDWSFLAPGARLEEALARMRRRSLTRDAFTGDLPDAISGAIAAGVKPNELRLPPAVRETAVRLVDPTLIVRDGSQLLFRLDLTSIPADAVVVTARLAKDGVTVPTGEVRPLAQRWVHGQADSLHARDGVAWMCLASGQQRGLPTFPAVELVDIIAWQRAHPELGNGFCCRPTVRVEDGAPGCALTIAYLSATAPADAPRPAFQLVQDAIVARLGGDSARASALMKLAVQQQPPKERTAPAKVCEALGVSP
jgi:hypothetical protein